MHRPTIAISMGDPAGIGPEVALKALADADVRALANWIFVGDRWVVEQLAGEIGYRPDRVTTQLDAVETAAGVLLWDKRQLSPDGHQFSRVNADCGRAALDYVRTSVELCLSGRAQAIVTAPLSKEAVALSGQHFSGHTEYIAELCGVNDSRMLLFNEQMRVVHVSTHCSLAEAARLSEDRILKTIELGHEALVWLGWPRPRIAVCGLNPHAGENGMFGNEESAVIAPAIERARSLGMNCEGPFPADTLFMQAVRGKCDLIVAMYHDQGHVPMKLLDFEHTVNVTLGLPIVRTSVDHGTAFDIAGQNLANADDMKTAMRLAVRLVECRELAAS